jgi:hypothetical protein
MLCMYDFSVESWWAGGASSSSPIQAMPSLYHHTMLLLHHGIAYVRPVPGRRANQQRPLTFPFSRCPFPPPHLARPSSRCPLAICVSCRSQHPRPMHIMHIYTVYSKRIVISFRISPPNLPKIIDRAEISHRPPPDPG